jgi:hypothetical protein
LDLDGIPQITAKTLPSTECELLLLTAGYGKIGTAAASGKSPESVVDSSYF